MDTDLLGSRTDREDGWVAIPAPAWTPGCPSASSGGPGLEETCTCATGTCIHLHIYRYRNIDICIYASTCVQRKREREEVAYICIHAHVHAHTHIYICVYAYIFMHLNPVLPSITLFAVIHRGEISVSGGIGGLPCPLQPLHHPK